MRTKLETHIAEIMKIRLYEIPQKKMNVFKMSWIIT